MANKIYTKVIYKKRSQGTGLGYFLGRPRGLFVGAPSTFVFGGAVLALGAESSFLGLPRFLLPLGGGGVKVVPGKDLRGRPLPRFIGMKGANCCLGRTSTFKLRPRVFEISRGIHQNKWEAHGNVDMLHINHGFTEKTPYSTLSKFRQSDIFKVYHPLQ